MINRSTLVKNEQGGNGITNRYLPHNELAEFKPILIALFISLDF